MTRSSYSKLSKLPVYGLFKDHKLIATIRAHNIYEAQDLFRKNNMHGDRIRKMDA